VDPRDHVLGEGPDPPPGNGTIMARVVFAPQMHCNSESCENGNMNCTLYIPIDIVWPQQYAGVVRSCVYANKQFETRIVQFAGRRATALISDAPVA